MMTIIHIVLFKFNPSMDNVESEVRKICNDMISLKDKCIDTETQKPYIVKASGGIDNSPEALQGGFSHAFVFEFASTFDRDYYVNADPAHQAFKDSISGKVVEARVLDYEPHSYW